MNTKKLAKSTCVRRKHPAAKVRRIQPPDLTSVINSFSDATALVSVASKVIANSPYSGPEASVLRLGVEALERASDQLEEADLALNRFLEKKTVAKGGEA